VNKVLIVEDNDAARLALRHVIEKKFKFQVEEAVNGVEGLAKFSKFQPDLILLDVAMPLMNGKEFLEAIRNDAEYNHVNVIVLTAMNDKNIVREMVELGISDYIFKPFEREDVMNRINNIIAKTSLTNRRKGNKNIERVSSLFSRSILLVDKDPLFLNFIEELFGDKTEVIVAQNGAECLQLYVNKRPQIVIMGQNLSIINEFLLAKKISEFDSNKDTEIYLAVDKDTLTPEQKMLYTAVLQKSLIPEVFIREFATKVLHNTSIFDLFTAFVQSMQPDLIDSVKQTFEIASPQELLVEEQSGDCNPEGDYCIKTTLAEKVENIEVTLFLCGFKQNLDEIVSIGTSGEEQPVMDFDATMIEHINTIANRLRLLLKTKGIFTNYQEPIIDNSIDDLMQNDVKLIIPFKNKNSKCFVLGVTVSQKG